MTPRPAYAAAGVAMLVVATVTSCAPQQDLLEPTAASPTFIQQLASEDRSIEGIDVCQALRDARDSTALADLVGTTDIAIEDRFAEEEDSVAGCGVVPARQSDMGLEISLRQGTEPQDDAVADPEVFPGCHLAPSSTEPGHAWAQVTCLPGLTIDAEVTLDSDSVIDSRPLGDLLGDVLDAVSRQR